MPACILPSQDTMVSPPSLLYQAGNISIQGKSSARKRSWALPFEGKQLERNAFKCKTVHKAFRLSRDDLRQCILYQSQTDRYHQLLWKKKCRKYGEIKLFFSQTSTVYQPQAFACAESSLKMSNRPANHQFFFLLKSFHFSCHTFFKNKKIPVFYLNG